MSTTILYNDTEIANFSNTSKTIKCKDNLMDDDLVVTDTGGGAEVETVNLHYDSSDGSPLYYINYLDGSITVTRRYTNTVIPKNSPLFLIGSRGAYVEGEEILQQNFYTYVVKASSDLNIWGGGISG